jgi:hypothetical protein
MTGKKGRKDLLGEHYMEFALLQAKEMVKNLLMIRQKQKKVNFNNVMGEEGRIKSERNVTTKSQSIW